MEEEIKLMKGNEALAMAMIRYGADGATSEAGVKTEIVPFNSDQTLTDGLITVSFNDLVYIPDNKLSNTDKIVISIPSNDPTLYRSIRITIQYTINDNCVDPEFNDSQYVSNRTQIVRGTFNNSGELVMQTTLAEAFVDYLENYGNNNHNYKFRIDPESTVYGVEVTSHVSDGGSVYDYREQIIALTNELGYYGDMNEVRRVPVQFVAMRDNGTEHSFNYYVEFRSPFVVTAAQPVNIPTDAPVETDDFAKRVDVTLINGNALVWDNKTVTKAAATYGLDASDFNFTYRIAEGEDQNGRLSIDPTTGVITWSNDGSTLLEDTPAHVVITLQVPGIVTFETVIPITLKKTTVGGE